MRRRGIGRAGRPSLVGTMARTAVIAGTASAVSGRVAARHQPAATVQTPDVSEAGGLSDQVVDQLKKLGELRDAGILTEEEFTAKKAVMLGI
jgi:Short C-terminal domain